MKLTSRFGSELLGQMIAAISGAVLIISLSRLLGPADYGLLFLAISILGTLQILAELGIAKSAARYISEYKETDSNQINHILKNSLYFNIISIVFVSGIILMTHQYISTILGEPELSSLLLFGIFYVIFGALTKYTRFILQGFESIQYSALVHSVDKGSRLFLAIGFVILGYGAIGALGGYIFGFLVATVLGFVVIYTKFYRDYISSSSIEPELRRRIAEYTLPLTATSSANVIDKSLDTVLVGFFLTPTAVSFYTLGKQIVEFVRTPADAVGFTLAPSFGSKKASGNIDRASQLYETALVNSLLLYIPAAAGLILVSNPMIELIFGPEYLGASLILQILSVHLVLQSVAIVSSNGLDFLGRARSRAIARGITAILNVGFNILLIPVLGVEGAAVATILTYSLYTAANLYIINQELRIRKKYITKELLKISTITILMSIPVYLLSSQIRGYVMLAITVIAGVFIWSICSVVGGFLNLKKAIHLFD